MAKAIGIDLGTTNSVAGIKKGDIKILQNRESEDSTKSCVCWYKGRKGDGQILVGSPAIDKMMPRDTIISVKRLVGRAYSDPEIQRIREKVSYKIVAPSDGTDDDLRVVMGGKQYSPVQISSMILKKIKEDAEERLNDKVEEAVITVPAYFTDKQRDATREAGWLAGLKVQKILPEPTAAAIAYGMDNINENEARTILIYDLGGGTFDVSILSIAGGIFAELGIEGNMWLGGDDFDQKIMDFVVKTVQDEYEIDIEKMDDTKKLRFILALKREAEKAKRALSSSTSTEITMIGMLEDEDRNLIDVVVDLTRDDFEQMIQNDIKKSIELVRTAIKNAHLTQEQIDSVILVGGSTMIPMIKRALVDEFGKDKVLTNVDPMKCVSQGAAILSAILAGEIECPNSECKTINPKDNETCFKCGKPLSIDEVRKDIGVYGLTSMDYGILTVGDRFEPVIKKGSPYPSPEPVVEIFYTSESNMRRIKVPVFALDENESRLEHQAIVWLELPEGVPHDIPVDVAFALDNDGILERVRVSLKDGSGREVEVNLDRGNNQRSRVEKKMDEIKSAWDRKQKDADSSVRQEIEKLYSDAIMSANANDIEGAEEKMKEFEKRVSEVGRDESEMPEWMRLANGIANYADFMVGEYGFLLDPQKTYKLKKLIEEVKSAVEKENRELAEQKTAELNKEVDDVGGLVADLMAIRHAIVLAQNRGNVVKADKVRSMLSEIEDALKRNDIDTVKGRMSEVVPLVKEIFQSSGEQVQGAVSMGELLKRNKGHATSDQF